MLFIKQGDHLIEFESCILMLSLQKNPLSMSYFIANSLMQFHSKNVTKIRTAASGRLL